jgi:hypothetical protein
VDARYLWSSAAGAHGRRAGIVDNYIGDEVIVVFSEDSRVEQDPHFVLFHADRALVISAHDSAEDEFGKRLRVTPSIAASASAAVVAMLWFAYALLSRTSPVIGRVLPLAAVIIVSVSAWRAGTPQTDEMSSRSFWRYVSAGMALIGCGTASNAWDSISGNEQGQHVSGRTSIIFLAGLLVMMVGLLRIPGTRRCRGEWTGFGLDITTVIVTALTTCGLPVLRRLFGAGARPV